MKLRLFLRQSFTQAGDAEQTVVQNVIDTIRELDHPERPLTIVTGQEAQNASSFGREFEMRSGLPFSPRAFRKDRIQLLADADAMIIVRTGLSESSAFEIAYNVYGGRRIPMFFAVWKQAPIKTTLLQELEEFCFVCYQTFSDVNELRDPLANFIKVIPCQVNSGAVDSLRT